MQTLAAIVTAALTAIINLIHPEPRFEPDGYDL